MFVIDVVWTIAMLLSQSMVWSRCEEENGVGNKIKKWVLVIILSHFVVFFFYLTPSESEQEGQRRRSYWNDLESFRNHQTLCRSCNPLSWESVGTAFVTAFFFFLVLLFSLDQGIWDPKQISVKTALATQAVCFNMIWIKEGHGVCTPVPTLDWMGYLGLLTALQRDRSKLITGDCKSLFWLSADSFYKFVKIKRFRKLSEEGFLWLLHSQLQKVRQTYL